MYQYRKGQAEASAFCTRCGHEVTLREPRNRRPAKCPCCHTTLTCISEKSLADTNGYRTSRTAAYFQPTREGFCLRVFHADVHIRSDNYRDIRADCLETERHFYSIETDRWTQDFEWGEFESSREVRWCRKYSSYAGRAVVYPKNLKRVFCGEAWKYLPMTDLARNCGELDLYGFVYHTKHNLGLEHLAKHGLWRLAAEKVSYSTDKFKQARTIREAMGGLPMDEIRLLMAVNPDAEELSLYKAARRFERITPETMKRMVEMGFHQNRDALTDILQRTTWRRASGYIEAQRKKYPKENRFDWERRRYRDMPAQATEVASEWRDYLRDAEALEWDLSDDFLLFPRDLRAAHRQTILALEDKRNQKLDRKILDYRAGKTEGSYDNPVWLPFIFGMPDDPEEAAALDIYDEALWYRVNPSLGVTIPIEKLRMEALDARQSPAAERLFRWLRLNQWIAVKAAGWLPLTVYDNTGEDIPPEDLRGKKCYVGMDLSSTTDLTAVTLLFPPQPGLTHWHALFRVWIPEVSMKERERRDHVPFRLWKDAGYLDATAGDCVDYDYIEARIVRDAKEDYRAIRLGSDQWNSRMLTQRLEQAKVTEIVEIPQTMAGLSAAMKTMERLLRKGEMTHQKNPCARWCFGNVRCAVDGNENIKPMKNRSLERIDVVTSWIIAMAAALLDGEVVDKNEVILKEEWSM